MVSSDFSLTAAIQPIMTICMIRVMTLFTTLYAKESKAVQSLQKHRVQNSNIDHVTCRFLDGFFQDKFRLID